MKIDIIMCTKNSERILETCLNSIYKNISLNNLIVIDGYSKDNTLKILKKYNNKFKNIKIIQYKGNLGKSREKGINYIETKWFAFIDSDVLLEKNWFNKIRRYMRFKNVGAIESNFIHHYSNNINFMKFNNIKKNRRIDIRGYTIATLILTEAVQNINIPFDLKIFEDEYIKRYVENNGYKWIKVIKPIVHHFPNPKPFKDAFLTGVYSKKYNLYSQKRILYEFISSPLRFFYILIISRSLKKAKNSLIYSILMFKGLLSV